MRIVIASLIFVVSGLAQVPFPIPTSPFPPRVKANTDKKEQGIQKTVVKGAPFPHCYPCGRP